MLKKFLSSSLLVFLLSAQAIADETPRFIEIEDFSMGLNTQVSVYNAPANQGVISKNVRYNKVYTGLAKRSTNLGYVDCGSHSIQGLHRYYKTSDGTKKTMIAGSTLLYIGTESDGTCQTIGQGFSDGIRWTFTTYKDVAIGMNGVNNAIKYDGKTNVTANTDGHRTASDVVAELGAPFAELNTGSNLDASSWYIYKVAFFDGTLYDYETARSNVINTGSSVRDITLTDIPLGPTGTTQRIIYRISGNATRAGALASTTYYRVATISDNTTRTYNDAVTDATIEADTAPTFATVSAGTNVTPPLGKYSTIHDERLFVSGNATFKSDVYYSDTFNPDHFDPASFVQIRPDDGDEVTFMKELLGILTIGKTNSIQKFYTEGATTDWQVSNVFSFIGSPAAYSVANTPLGIFYLGWNGIYRFTGQYSELVSDAVTPEILDILQSNYSKVAGYFFRNEYHLAYTSIATGGTTNNRVLVYDTIRNAYTLDTKNINVFEAFDSGDDFGVLHHGSSLADGKVLADEGSGNILAIRTKSDFNLGTFDDSRLFGDDDEGHPHFPVGTESDFHLNIAWTETINDVGSTINGTSGIIDRPDTDGTWLSPVYQINASLLEQLQWNETLGSYGDITFQVRTGATAAACAAASFSTAFTDPSGSDLTGLTADAFIQVRINLSTTDITESPTINVVDNYAWRIFYQKTSATKEAAFESQWRSGWLNFGIKGHKKFIRRIRVFYKATASTLNFVYENDQGDVSRNFNIDFSVDGDALPNDDYYGTGDFKYYEHYPGPNTSTDPGPTGEYWRFTLTESGIEGWSVHKIEIEYYPEEIF